MSQLTAEHAATQPFEVMVRGIRFEARDIYSFELTAPDFGDLPAFEAGAHIDVHLPGGLIRSYSLSSDPANRRGWVLGILREGKGRGGSRTMHDKLRVGDRLTVGPVRNAFALSPHAAHTILLAGGIGITPLKAMAHTLQAQGQSYELHYCAKTPAHAAFVDELKTLIPEGRLHFHYDGGDPTQGLDIAQLLSDIKPDTHVYYCGPSGFMTACRDACAHWPSDSVHFEHFKVPKSAPATEQIADGSFEVHLLRSGQTIVVKSDESIVRAIEMAGHRIMTSCLSGLCGSCKVDYVDGEVDHRDYILTDEEKTRCLTTCVSRAKSKSLSLDI